MQGQPETNRRRVTVRPPSRGAPWWLLPLALLCAIGGGLYHLSRTAQPAKQAWYASVCYTDKPGRVRESSSASWKPTEIGAALGAGAEVSSDKAERCVVDLGGDTTARLASGSTVQIVSLSDVKAALGLVKGRLWLVRAPTMAVEVRCGADTFSVNGSAAEFEYYGEVLAVRAREGEIVRLSGDRREKVATGFELLMANGAVVSNKKSRATLDAWESWNRLTAKGGYDDASHPQQVAKAPAAAPPGPQQGYKGEAMAHATAPAPRGGGVQRTVASQPNAAGGPPRAAPAPGNPAIDHGAANGMAGPRADNAGPRTDNAGARTDNAGSRTDNAGSRTDSAGSKFDIPISLTRKGLPNTTYVPYRRLPVVNTETPAGLKRCFDQVAVVMSRKFTMRLRTPVVIDFLPVDSFGQGTSAAAGPAATGGDFRLYKFEPGSDRHRLQTIRGLPNDLAQELCAWALGEFWLYENEHKGQDSPERQRERRSFGRWLDVKYLLEMGDTQTAQGWLTAPMDSQDDMGPSHMLSLERDYGEYGVFYYVLNGVPPVY